MKKRLSNIPLLLLILFLFGFPDLVSARQQTGVIWEIPESSTEMRTQLKQFEELGVSYLEVQHPVSPDVLNQIAMYEFRILIRSDHQFLTLSDFLDTKEQLAKEFKTFVTEYKSAPNITAFGLLSNSQVYNDEFYEAITPVLDSLSQVKDNRLYAFANHKWWYFDEPKQPFATLFPDKYFTSEDLHTFNKQLKKDNSGLLFMHSGWLIQGIHEYPELKQSLVFLSENNQWKLPLPEQNNTSFSFNWAILLVLLMWVSIAVLLRFVPSYRAYLTRYFTAHSFLVEDVLLYRERSAVNGLAFVILHALCGGLVFYLLAQTFLSATGVDAFFFHLPYLALAGSNTFSFFLSGTILILIIQFIALIWIYFSNEELNHFSQALNLYTGIFHVDIILVTIMLVLSLTGVGNFAILVLSLIYLLIWFLAFNVAAYDASLNMIQGRGSYLFYTIGIHSILFLLALILILVLTDFTQILSLSLNI